MKILKRILYAILGLFVFLCAFVLLCAVKPGFSDQIAGFLYRDREPEKSEASLEGDGGEVQTEPDGGSSASGAGADPAGDGQGGAGRPDGGALLPRERSDMVAADGGLGYIQPEQSGLVIPAGVSGRNGYEPVSEQEEQLDEDAAEQIRELLGVGETGDGLVFDPLYCPYYEMLDEKGQHLYRQIYANAGSFNRAFAPVEEITPGQLADVFTAVYNDHPELFWLNTAYSCKYVRDGACVEIDLEFNRTVQDPAGSAAQFSQNAERILAVARTLEGDYEKEKYVHDALIGSVSYDLGAEMNQSAYSALVNGRTVCAGYARAYQFLMRELGIPCYYCTGYAGEDHAWNIVMLEGEYYNVDVTWDDTDGGNYDYFNKTDSDYADTHIRQDLSVYLPPCNGQAYRNREEAQEQGGNRNPSGSQGEDGGTDPAGSGEQGGARTPEAGQVWAEVQGAARERRSLEEAGFTAESLLYDLQSYYDHCFAGMTAAGAGSHEMKTVLEGEALMQEVYEAYETEQYREGFLDRAMEAIGVSACDMVLDVETLTGDRYLITHRIHLW